MSEPRRIVEGAPDDPVAIDTRVAVHMSRVVVIESAESTPSTALRAMLASGQRHLAVVDRSGTFLGVVASDVVAAATGPTLEGLTPWPVLRLSPISSMREAASVMMTNGVSAVGVLDRAGQVVGILEWSDILAMAAGRQRP